MSLRVLLIIEDTDGASVAQKKGFSFPFKERSRRRDIGSMRGVWSKSRDTGDTEVVADSLCRNLQKPRNKT